MVKNRIFWELFIMFTAAVNCIIIPFIIAFQKSYYDSPILILLLNYIIDVVFLIDIAVNWRTSYFIKKTGEEITNQRDALISYFKGRFLIDLMSVIPFEYLEPIFKHTNGHILWLSALGMLKIVRIFRLGDIITHLNLKNEVKTTLRLLKLVFFIFLFVHCLACFWYIIWDENKEWIPPFDYIYITTNLYEQSSSYKYLTSVYHAFLMIGGNDVGPRNEFQMSFVSIMLFVGAIINAIIFGNMAVMVQSINRKSTSFQEKVENANEAMKNLNIIGEIRGDVQHYLSYTQSALNHQKELDSFLVMLSPSLKQKVTSCIFYDSILENSVFRDNPDILNSFINNLQIKLFLPEDLILKQGEESNWMYFLARGECKVYVTGNNKKEIMTNSLVKGSYFGEVGLIKLCRRTASVLSKEYSTWALLNDKYFNELCDRYSIVKIEMEKRIRNKYNDKWKKFIKRSIKNIDYLSYNIHNDIIDDISYCFELISISQGEYLFKNATIWKDIHMISNGEINIFIGEHKKEQFLDTLYTGCTIGSYASLNADDYTISAKAKTDCTILRMPYRSMLTLRDKYDKLDQAISRYEEYTDANGIPYCDYKLHRNKNLEWSPIEKFRHGINRISKIVKSYKSSALTDL